MVWTNIFLNIIFFLINGERHISAFKNSQKNVAISPNSYTNPLIGSNCPDPGVIKLMDGSGWAAVTTSNYASRAKRSSAFPIHFSKDLVHWTLRSMVFTPANWPTWAVDSMWAPELHNVNGRYIVYYTARKTNGVLVSGAAIAENNNPFGHYVDIGRPLVEGKFGIAIDPHYFKDPITGHDYLLWNQRNLPLLQISHIYLSQLQPSGVSLKVNNLSQSKHNTKELELSSAKLSKKLGK